MTQERIEELAREVVRTVFTDINENEQQSYFHDLVMKAKHEIVEYHDLDVLGSESHVRQLIDHHLRGIKESLR
ncbi:hypothetical protein Q9251_03055 [Alkalihalobacillus macyae]|uniref:hypothetical protein n=1 Tax=Guptibacillus hwajinpoensis TaxID=208199 RepID=UPI00273BBE03|nr:hypothetical protein [Alkalihalobacillus macyae]MDP4549854.1 hypothetical protein [Alkalihalobacillus macyae]